MRGVPSALRSQVEFHLEDLPELHGLTSASRGPESELAGCLGRLLVHAVRHMSNELHILDRTININQDPNPDPPLARILSRAFRIVGSRPVERDRPRIDRRAWTNSRAVCRAAPLPWVYDQR